MQYRDPMRCEPPGTCQPWELFGSVDPTASSGFIVRNFAPTSLDRQAKELYTRMKEQHVNVWNPFSYLDKSMWDMAGSQTGVTKWIRAYVDTARKLKDTYLGNPAMYLPFKEEFKRRGWNDVAAGILMSEYEQMWYEGRVPQHFENPPPQMQNTVLEESIEKIEGMDIEGGVKKWTKFALLAGLGFVAVRYGAPLLFVAGRKARRTTSDRREGAFTLPTI